VVESVLTEDGSVVAETGSEIGEITGAGAGATGAGAGIGVVWSGALAVTAVDSSVESCVVKGASKASSTVPETWMRDSLPILM
jgi:hypothetical protein